MGVLVPSSQIDTAQRLLSKGKETADQEPERSWFQTKEERKKEKSKSCGVTEELAEHREEAACQANLRA